MQVSYRRLLHTLGREIPLDELLDRLIMIGLEVESFTDLGMKSGKVVIARILEMEPHPNADSLVVAQVAANRETPYNIVCGAKNMGPGDRVPLALEGATLPNGITLKKSKIRGVASEGMMCSGDELGITDDHSGLILLPDDDELYPIGAPFDALIDIKITPNRPDALSLMGLARDIAAVFELDPPAFPSTEVAESGAPASESAKVTVEAPDACPRYAGRVVRGVKVGPSPRWLARAVEMGGSRSINNIVDVTNYVLQEVGHPLHSFDLDLVAGGDVRVRRAQDGEGVITLDGQEVKLTAADLLIADPEKPIALAGIMGCGNTEIHDGTTNVFLECAYFTPAVIRATSKRLGKSTDSSYRFERGIDAHNLDAVVDFAARLTAEVSGGIVAPGRLVAGPGVPDFAAIELSLARVRAMLGTELSEAQATGALERLGFALEPAGDAAWRVTPPSWRPDVEGEADLVEEIGRIVGYDRIPAQLPRLTSVGSAPSSEAAMADLVRRELASAGFFEAYNYSFLSAEALKRCGFETPEGLALTNPLSAEYAQMRPSLIPGLLESVLHNQNHGNPDVALFEVGRVYEPAAATEDARDRTGVHETMQFAAVMAGRGNGGNWRDAASVADYATVRGAAERLLARLKIGAVAARRLDAAAGDPAWTASVFHPGKSAALTQAGGKETLLFVGELHPRLKESLGLKRPCVLLTGVLDNLTAAYAQATAFKVRSVAVYPGVSRDLALVADRDTPAADIAAVIAARVKTMLTDLQLFDVYEGDRLPEGRRSLAYTLTFGAADRTLTDVEVNKTIEKILADLKAKLGVELRG